MASQYIKGNLFGSDLCKVLNIDPVGVSRLVIVCDIRDVLTVYVKKMVEAEPEAILKTFSDMRDMAHIVAVKEVEVNGRAEVTVEPAPGEMTDKQRLDWLSELANNSLLDVRSRVNNEGVTVRQAIDWFAKKEEVKA